MAVRHSRRSREDAPALDIWQRITRLLAACFLLMGAAVGFLYFLPEKELLDQMEVTNRRLAERRDQLLAQKEEKLRLERESLSDPAYVEMIARDRLNMQLPGETVIRIDRGDFLPAGGK